MTTEPSAALPPEPMRPRRKARPGRVLGSVLALLVTIGLALAAVWALAHPQRIADQESSGVLYRNPQRLEPLHPLF